MYTIRYQTVEQAGTQDYKAQSTEDATQAMIGIINLLTSPAYKKKGYPVVYRGITTDDNGNTVIQFARICTKGLEYSVPAEDSLF